MGQRQISYSSARLRTATSLLSRRPTLFSTSSVPSGRTARRGRTWPSWRSRACIRSRGKTTRQRCSSRTPQACGNINFPRDATYFASPPFSTRSRRLLKISRCAAWRPWAAHKGSSFKPDAANRTLLDEAAADGFKMSTIASLPMIRRCACIYPVLNLLLLPQPKPTEPKPRQF